MKKSKISVALSFVVLVVCALPTILAVWAIFEGSIMSADEIETSLAPVMKGTEGMAGWSLIPSYPTLQSLVEMLLDTPEFFVMFWNSWGIVVPTILGQLFLAAPAAWALSRFRFRGRSVLLSVYIVLMLMPFQVTMVPNYLMIDTLGIMDNPLAVILPFAFSAFPVFIMTKGFDSIPMSVIEAAKVDGANRLQTFLRIGLPLGVPGILSALVLGFLDCWNAIEQPLLFLRTPSTWPLSLYLPQITEKDLGIAMVASLFTLLPAALIFLFGQKYLVLGIQSAGMKE